jgi:hypothetical protein
MSAQYFERRDDDMIGSAIAAAEDDLRRAKWVGNEADPNFRRHVLDAMHSLGNAIGVIVVEAAA